MSSNDLSLDIVSSADGFAALRLPWDELVLAAPRPSPFLLHAWVTAWWRHFGAGATLALVTARRDGLLVGLAPMYVSRHRGMLVCRMLGSHESALGDLLVGPGDDGSIGRALLDRLARMRFDYLDVFGPPENGVLPGLGPERGLTVLRRVESPVLRMPDGWEAMYASRISAKKRNLHRRRLRQLAELGAVSWTMASTADDVVRELEDAFEVHARRWRGRPDGSTFGLATGHEFHRDGARALAAQDAVRIMTLRIDGRPIAFHYWFVLGTTVYVHRVAFDPEFARFSPGQVTLLRSLAHASDEGARRVEFLGGDERYKVELADGFEPMCQVIGLPSGLPARLATRMLRWNIAARMRLKRNARLRRLYFEGLEPVRELLRKRRDAR